VAISGQDSITASIIKSRNPRNHVPKFQTKFGVAEEERDTLGSGLSRDTAKALATTFPDSNTQEPTGRTMKECPSISTSVTSQC